MCYLPLHGWRTYSVRAGAREIASIGRLWTPMDHPNPEIDFGRSVFVCSKPIQVLNCASIVRHFGIRESRLHVLTSSIDGAEDFARFVAGTDYDHVFSTVSWDVDHDAAIEAFTREPYDTLFIEDDRVGRYRIFEPYRTQRMVVFEEGSAPTAVIPSIRCVGSGS